MSQKALGEKIGLSNIQVSELERGLGGKKHVTPEMADKLVEAFGLDETDATRLRELYQKQYGTSEETG